MCVWRFAYVGAVVVDVARVVDVVVLGGAVVVAESLVVDVARTVVVPVVC